MSTPTVHQPNSEKTNAFHKYYVAPYLVRLMSILLLLKELPSVFHILPKFFNRAVDFFILICNIITLVSSIVGRGGHACHLCKILSLLTTLLPFIAETPVDHRTINGALVPPFLRLNCCTERHVQTLFLLFFTTLLRPFPRPFLLPRSD